MTNITIGSFINTITTDTDIFVQKNAKAILWDGNSANVPNWVKDLTVKSMSIGNAGNYYFLVITVN